MWMVERIQATTQYVELPPPDSYSTGCEMGWSSEEAAGIEATVLTKESIEMIGFMR